MKDDENDPRFLTVGFKGTIKSGVFKYDNTLSLSYTMATGEIWDHM